MSYSCSDAYSDITQALNLKTPASWDEDGGDHVSAETDLALAEILRLQELAKVPGPTATDGERIAAALAHLNAARELLKEAGARRTVERVRLAISSAKGAQRNARAKPYRNKRKQEARP